MRRDDIADLRRRIAAPAAGVEEMRATSDALLAEVLRQRARMIETAVPLALLRERIARSRVIGLGLDLEQDLMEAAESLRQEIC